jgi:hypothetical protein
VILIAPSAYAAGCNGQTVAQLITAVTCTPSVGATPGSVTYVFSNTPGVETDINGLPTFSNLSTNPPFAITASDVIVNEVNNSATSASLQFSVNGNIFKALATVGPGDFSQIDIQVIFHLIDGTAAQRFNLVTTNLAGIASTDDPTQSLDNNINFGKLLGAQTAAVILTQPYEAICGNVTGNCGNTKSTGGGRKVSARPRKTCTFSIC